MSMTFKNLNIFIGFSYYIYLFDVFFEIVFKCLLW